MTNTMSQRVIDGLLDLWEDIYFVQGKRSEASQLRSSVQAALAEPGSFIHKLIEEAPGQAQFYLNYTRSPISVRRKIIEQNLTNQSFQDVFSHLDYGIRFFAIVYQREGLTAIEAERRIEHAFEHELKKITLNDLLNKPPARERLHRVEEVDMHYIMSRLALLPGTVAGASNRLRCILMQRLKTSRGDTYEQDLKIALWKSSKGSHLDEVIKMMREQGDIEAQLDFIIRILDGEKEARKLMRTTLLRILRMTIEELPDIEDNLSDQRKQEEYLRKLNSQKRNQDEPLASIYIRDEAALERIEDKSGELYQYEDARGNILDMVIEKGVPIRRLDNRGLELLIDELARLKYGKTRKEYYGYKENQVKQQLKYLAKKLKG